ncbi:hypothetical protein Q5O89_01985 [Peribacillus frigoritolerans]|nr:hypothetical protein [Peribacillus frigoritolerans]
MSFLLKMTVFTPYSYRTKHSVNERSNGAPSLCEQLRFLLLKRQLSSSCNEEYFNKTVQPYVENKISFRSWAHVEWATLEEPLHIIEEFERTVDKAVNLLSFPLICALLVSFVVLLVNSGHLLVSFAVLLVNSGHLLVSTHFTPHKKKHHNGTSFFRN